MDYRKIAEEIYAKVGKKENLISAAHCATRLRLVIADNGKCDSKAVEEIEGVKGVFLHPASFRSSLEQELLIRYTMSS